MTSFAGAVLAGGKSARMGADKASIILGGRPMIDYSISALRSLRSAPTEIVIATSPDAARYLADPSCSVTSTSGRSIVRIVADPDPYRGPLSGLMTVLDEISATWALVLACDMPFVSGAVLDFLLDKHNEGDTHLVTVFRAGSRFHPFPGIYSRSISPICSELLSERKRSMKALLEHIPTLVVDLPSWAPPDSLDSVNTRADLRRAEDRLAASPGSDPTHSAGAS